MPQAAPERRAEVKSLRKAMQVLDCFTEAEPRWRVSDLARRLGMPKSTVSTILSTLLEGGYVRQTADGRYAPGLRLFELGFVVRHTLGVREYVLPILEEVQQATQEIVYLTIPRDGEVLYIEAVYPTKRLVHYSIAGRRGPMHCTGVGKATLAHMSRGEVEAIVARRGLPRFTDNTITTMEGLLEELERVRSRGYAVDNEEHNPGVRCVAVPILSQGGRVLGAISVSGPPLHFTEERIPQYAALLQQAAAQIARYERVLMLEQ